MASLKNNAPLRYNSSSHYKNRRDSQNSADAQHGTTKVQALVSFRISRPRQHLYRHHKTEQRLFPLSFPFLGALITLDLPGFAQRLPHLVDAAYQIQ